MLSRKKIEDLMVCPKQLKKRRVKKQEFSNEGTPSGYNQQCKKETEEKCISLEHVLWFFIRNDYIKKTNLLQQTTTLHSLQCFLNVLEEQI
uniref:Uncharacterized protein n=1 Tax=Pyxicephalus adspersus TaxID=30357 RepID=A0AAV3B141_PYXAD|nr:TPA: hypothetical protein GDO54_000818 [Pyxicephalus adspersus]